MQKEESLRNYLDFKYGSAADPERRLASLHYARRMMAKIFGVGKSSKNRPTAILDNAKEVYEQMGEEIQRLQPAGAAESADAS